VCVILNAAGGAVPRSRRPSSGRCTTWRWARAPPPSPRAAAPTAARTWTFPPLSATQRKRKQNPEVSKRHWQYNNKHMEHVERALERYNVAAQPLTDVPLDGYPADVPLRRGGPRPLGVQSHGERERARDVLDARAAEGTSPCCLKLWRELMSERWRALHSWGSAHEAAASRHVTPERRTKNGVFNIRVSKSILEVKCNCTVISVN